MKSVNEEGQLELKTKKDQEQRRKFNKSLFRYTQQINESIFYSVNFNSLSVSVIRLAMSNRRELD